MGVERELYEDVFDSRCVIFRHSPQKNTSEIEVSTQVRLYFQ